MPSKQENVNEVFYWILDILKNLEIRYHITGGLAAVAYGSKREIYDIDIDIAEQDFDKLADKVRPFITFGPGNFQDPKWDLTMITIRYKDVDIDISGAYTGKIFDEANNQWVPYESDLKNTEEKELLGTIQPIISKNILIKYKKILGRPTDLEDIEAMR